MQQKFPIFSQEPLMSRRTFLTTLMLGLTVAITGCKSPTLDKTQMTTLPKTSITPQEEKEIALIAGGCFWCTEAIFIELKGVEKAESGYAGGFVENPSYKQVCGGDTGHAEAIRITFDPKIITYSDILHIFMTTHDPTTLNRQGADSGTQYRSAIFYMNDTQKETAEKVIAEVDAAHIWKDKIVTEVTAFSNYYKAEDYHQDYYAQNGNAGYCRAVISPKVTKFRAKYRDKLKRE